MARTPARKAGVLDGDALLPVRNRLSAGGKWIRTSSTGSREPRISNALKLITSHSDRLSNNAPREEAGFERASRHRYRAAMSVNFCLAGFWGRGTGIRSFLLRGFLLGEPFHGAWSREPRWVWEALVCDAG
jgi:hypothetical protein